MRVLCSKHGLHRMHEIKKHKILSQNFHRTSNSYVSACVFSSNYFPILAGLLNQLLFALKFFDHTNTLFKVHISALWKHRKNENRNERETCNRRCAEKWICIHLSLRCMHTYDVYCLSLLKFNASALFAFLCAWSSSLVFLFIESRNMNIGHCLFRLTQPIKAKKTMKASRSYPYRILYHKRNPQESRIKYAECCQCATVHFAK